ncbi:MAG: DMT family transporter [Burkholderiales bacterium]|nr:DMT family transporter [Burkholderiales bacterium]
MKSADFLLLVALAALWGASYPFLRVAAPEFGVLALVAVRVAIAALFLLPFVIARGKTSELLAHFPALVVNGAVNSVVPFLLITFSMLSLSAGFGAILNSTAPFFTALLAFAWLGERLSRPRQFGLLTGFAGVIVLVWDRESLAAAGAGWAFAAALAAALSYAIGANYSRRRLARIDPVAVAAGGQLAATVLIAPLAAFHLPPAPPSAAAWAAVTALGVAASGAAHVFYFRLIATSGPVPTVAVAYLIPVFGMLWGTLFLGESVTAHMAAGTAIILAGTALATGLLARAARS